MDFKKLSVLFFLVYFMAGLFLFKDYGINWDDLAQRNIGLVNWNYIFHHDKELLTYKDKYYGPVVEVILIGVERGLHLSDTRDIYIARHFAIFTIFFLSVLAFFLSARIVFRTERWALISCLMLVLSPRIFGESFFNPKDMMFLSAMIFAFCTMVWLLERPGYIRLLVHAIASAIAMDIRVLGILLVGATMLLLAKEVIDKPTQRKKYLSILALFPLLFLLFMVVFWPIMWKDPIHNFIQAMVLMKSYPWDANILYMGNLVNSLKLPWHYLPVWILISTPVLFTICWFMAILVFAKKFVSQPLIFIRENLLWGLIVFLCVGPVLSIIALHSTIYNGWRHLFFIYPFFVLIATYGLKYLWEEIPTGYRKYLNTVIILYFTLLSGIIVYAHPYENTYFNFPALQFFKPVSENFELDVWGLSYRQGLEYIVRSDSSKPIHIYPLNWPGFGNSMILKKADRYRLAYQDTILGANYFITNHYHYGYHGNIPGKKVYETVTFGNPILTVYKLDRDSI